MSKRIVACLSVCMLLAAVSAAVAQRPGHRRPPRDDKAPKVGQVAPNFTLKSLDGKRTVRLKEFAGKRPVLLFFGSYT